MRRIAERHADPGEEQDTEADLGKAETKDFLPHRPEAGGLHLKADDKQEHHHAEFGDMQDGRRLGEHPEAERADDETGGEIAKHRAKADLLEQGHRKNGRPQQDHDRGKINRMGGVSFGGHDFPLRTASRPVLKGLAAHATPALPGAWPRRVGGRPSDLRL